MDAIINRNTNILANGSFALQKAKDFLRRDMDKALERSEEQGADICLMEDESIKGEQFFLQVRAGRLEIHAKDTLGFIYGMCEISRTFLEIPDFWFWMDYEPAIQKEVRIKEGFVYRPKPYTVKYRGWFINDEILFQKWNAGKEKSEPWEMAIETLLRCGGNTVGFESGSSLERCRKLVSQLGLYITWHHEELSGDKILTPVYEQYQEKLPERWEDIVNAYKGRKVIWNIGSYGLEDCHLRENDLAHRAKEGKGAQVSDLIKARYDLVKEQDKEAVCSINLCGEIKELYQRGKLPLPDDVIRVWSDNEYRKRFFIRKDHHSIRALAQFKEGDVGRNGIYCHVAFYDLQAADHITMFPDSAEFMIRKLKENLRRNGKDLWIINCSDIKSHVYFLDLIAHMWREGAVYAKDHRRKYADCYYGKENGEKVAVCLAGYAGYATWWGKGEEGLTGGQSTNYIVRMIVSQLMRDQKKCSGIQWTAREKSLKGQALWHETLCRQAAGRCGEYLAKCERTQSELSGKGKKLFADMVLLKAKILYCCYEGALLAVKGVQSALEGKLQEAFFLAGRAREEYLSAGEAMGSLEHGKWRGFYASGGRTDVEQTVWVLESMMSFVRNLGDGPDFHKWQKAFLYLQEDKGNLPMANGEGYLGDLELFGLMEKEWDQNSKEKKGSPTV